jgi:AraC-like DNA-binding protein
MRFIRFHQQRMKQVPPPVVVDRGYKTPCWEWAGFREHGYGVMGQPGTRKVVRAHIAFYEEKYGPVPEGYELDHLCKNKPCCNPDHVEPVTHTENMRRSPTTKLTPDDVRKIREMKPRYLARELADMFGVTISAIYSIASRKTWQDIE